MLSSGESAFLVVASMVVAVFVVALLNRFWPTNHRKLVNDVTGWQLGILGTTYGVILGFMLSTVWTGFHNAENDASLEAASVMNIYRIAAELPSPEREEMQRLAMKYADLVVNQEWPAMQRQMESHAGGVVLVQMWEVLKASKENQTTDSTRVDHLTTVMSNLGERRSQREQQRRSQLPGVMWALLILGGVATVVSSCALGNDTKWLHYCQVLALTFVVSVTLAAIADLARPYEGSVAVAPTSFVRALESMQGRSF
jgi:hypothetical protein